MSNIKDHKQSNKTFLIGAKSRKTAVLGQTLKQTLLYWCQQYEEKKKIKHKLPYCCQVKTRNRCIITIRTNPPMSTMKTKHPEVQGKVIF